MARQTADVPSADPSPIAFVAFFSGQWRRTRRFLTSPLSLRKGKHAGRARWFRPRWQVLPVLAVGALAAVVAMLQMSRPLPLPVTHAARLSAMRIPGTAAPIPWPVQGQGAVEVPQLGMVLTSGAEQPVPVASLTKIMTAYIILRDHPITPSVQGPEITMSAADQSEAISDENAGDTYVPVLAGEVLTERQLLDGLLVHSANNFADALAKWDAGSIAQFVSKMNAAAVSLGMRGTHYADASGIDPQTVSTAADQLTVATAAMTIPTFVSVVSQPSITLPLAGKIDNYVTQIGSDGIIGVKSGFTDAALGCLVLAAQREVDGRQVLVLAAVTGQPGLDPLDAAADSTVNLIDATASSLREVPALAAGQRVASVTVPWSSSPVAGETVSSAEVLVWPGDTVRRVFTAARLRSGEPPGATVGTVEVVVGSEHSTVPVRSVNRLPTAPLAWRLEDL